VQFPLTIPLIPLLALLAVGCGGLKDVTNSFTGGGQDPYSAYDPTGGIPEELRAGRAEGRVRTQVAFEGEDPALRSRRQNNGSNTTILTPEEDIVFTNPDDPDAPLPGLEDLILENKDNAAWSESYSDAKKHSQREGKPLLIWFTDSKRSPVCKTLSRELFSTPEFESWAVEEVVRLRLDFNIKDDGKGDNQMDREIRKKDYLKMLEKRFKATGKPHVLVLAPDGTNMGRYRGYRPNSADFFFGKLKHSAILARKHHTDWVKAKEKQGYRTWHKRRGDFTVFAKLVRYRRGEMILVEPDGGHFKTKESNLSDEDRLWLAGQQARRQ